MTVEAAVSAAFFDAGGTPAITDELLQHDRWLMVAELFGKRHLRIGFLLTGHSQTRVVPASLESFF